MTSTPATPQIHPQAPDRRRWPRVAVCALLVIYAAVLVYTNARFTILDDEAGGISRAGHSVANTFHQFFLSGELAEEHPPASNILLHLWLVATNYSLFAVRILANLLYIASVFCTAKAADKIGGQRAFWAALILGCVWPFAFQYGRIAGWYAMSTFLVSALTWAYLEILSSRSLRPWVALSLCSIFLVWTNYFGFVFLFLLLADLLVFHRSLARARAGRILVVAAAIAAAFLPIVSIAARNLSTYVVPVSSRFDLGNEVARFAYPAFAIFASAAVAPWYLPLSLPIALASIGLFCAIFLSSGKRWLVYFLIVMLLLQFSGEMNIKRVLSMLPWLFIAMALAISRDTSRLPGLATGTITIIVICGWAGILSGAHYATTNLYEPWQHVAEMVAVDVRNGATVIGENSTFLLYLNYQLGLEAESGNADSGYLGDAVYASHGYAVDTLDDPHSWVSRLRGKVVLVQGTDDEDAMKSGRELDLALRTRCTILGEYHSTPDPAERWKQRFVRNAPVIHFRVNATWYDCP